MYFARICAMLLVLVGTALAGDPVEKGGTSLESNVTPHSEMVRRVVKMKSRDGETLVTNSYVRLGTGLFCEKNGKLIEADPVIELRPGGAVAEKARHSIKFSANINDWDGAIDLKSSGGKRFLSRPLGIAYFDTATGESVLIAEFKDSVGVLFPPSKILYQDAFTDFKADLEYNNSRAGLQQNLIFRQCPPEPSHFGLNNETTYIQLLTEFFESPAATKKTSRKNGIDDDVELDFDGPRIGPGKGFLIGDERRSILVEKQWVRLDGRQFLVEQMPYSKIAGALKSLLDGARVQKQKNKRTRHVASKKRVLPERPIAKAEPKNERIEVASLALPQRGFVLDYTLLPDGVSDTHVVLQGDFTYFIENDVFLDALTIEGGRSLSLEQMPLLFTSTER